MTMNPYLSWAIVIVVGCGLGWYYHNGNAPKAKAATRSVVEKAEATVAPKKPKQKKAPKSSELAPKNTEIKTVVSPPTTEDEKPEDDVDQKEMARRLAAIKNGTSQSQAPKNQKKKAKKTAQLESNSHASSTTGADADDDLSPAVSPQVAAATSAGYVSDMLEAPAPAASVLRVTGNVESEPKKQKAQSFKPVETKKQRQNRLKNEARKEQVREAEEERRKLLEKQLHTARESERREAANSQAPTTNAWQSKAAPKTNGTAAPTPAAPAAAPAAAPVHLLDTFEPATTAPAPNKWDKGLPSEEEQIRILGAADDEWTTVSTKKPKKKTGKADESVSETSASETQPAPVAPVVAEPRVTVTPTYIPDILRSTQKGHPLDSDWAA